MVDATIRSPVTGGETSHAEWFDVPTILARYGATPIKVEHYFTGRDRIELRRCEDTGYRFYYPPELAGEADLYENIFKDTDPTYREWGGDHQFAFDRIRSGDRVLDIGAGAGWFLRRVVEKAQAFGIEGSEPCRAECASAGLDVRGGTVQDHVTEWADSFDVVCSFHVLEHVFDVRGFLGAAKAVLKPGGKLIIAVPNNEPYSVRFNKYSTYNMPPHHIGLWNERSLRLAGERMGLTWIESATVDPQTRVLVDAYMRARYWMGVKSDIHQHPPLDWARILLAAPLTVPLSFVDKLRRGGQITSGTIAVVFTKAA